MRDVKLVRLSDDGTHVVLTHEGTGEEFALRIDDRLRGFVTSDRARVGQLPVERRSRLSPKEIQARLRAGESSEDIAAAADVPLERILRYAGPVLAEREYIAEQARRAGLRRQPGEGTTRTLGDAVEQELERIGVATDQARWDAWRSPDGRWAVAVIFTLDGEENKGVFAYDPVGRTVLATDDTARSLIGERRSEPERPATAERPPHAPVVEGPGPRTPRDVVRPRLTAVPPPVEETRRPVEPVVRPLRPKPAEVAPPEPAAEEIVDDPIAYEDTVDLSRTLAHPPEPEPEPDATEPPALGPDELPDLGTSTSRPVEQTTPHPQAPRPRPAPRPTPTPEPAPVEEPASEPSPTDAPATAAEPVTVPRAVAAPEPAAAPAAETAQPATREPEEADRPEPEEPEPEREAPKEPERPAAQLGRDRRTSESRRRRAAGSKRKGAVPSWDDILFGGGRGKD